LIVARKWIANALRTSSERHEKVMGAARANGLIQVNVRPAIAPMIYEEYSK